MRRRLRFCASEPLEPRVLLSASTNTELGESPAQVAELNQLAGADDASSDSTTYPGGITVTPSEIRTMTDVIPRFVAEPTVISVQSGGWANPNTWSTGSVPAEDDLVLIAAGTTVTYASVSDHSIDAIEVGGRLVFSPFVNTRMVVGTITVMPVGTLEIGTPLVPVRSNVTAELIIADRPLDLQNDPSQFAAGLIGFGKVTMHGSELATTWTRLVAEPRAGNQFLRVAQVDPYWRPGDTLVIPDSRQVAWSQESQFTGGQLPPQWEEVTIDRIFGGTIVLQEPLQFDHLGARNADGELVLLPHVATLTRNVIVRSENPQGTRGHVLLGGRADVAISYARFSDLGRTDAFRDLDNTTFAPDGTVTHIGTNQIARYAMHFHHLIGPENPSNSGYQFKFVGNTVDRSLKWGVAVHGTSFGLLERNVVYDADGAGFVTEDGSEIGNAFRNNIAIRIVGTMQDGKAGTQEGDYARGGSGFWFRRSGNQIVGNVAADSSFSGFVFDGYYVTEPVRLPLFRGAARHMPGQGYTAELNPPNWFVNNEAYGLSTYGLWAAFASGDNLADNHPTSVLVDLRIWNVFLVGVRAYHTANMTFNGLTIYGDPSAQDRNDVGTYGMHLTTYENRGLQIRNSRIEGMRVGIATPRSDASQAGRPRPTVIQDTSLANYVNILVSPTWDYGTGNGTALEVRNVKFDLMTEIPDGPADSATIDPPANIRMNFEADDADLTQPSTVRVYDYNQVPGDDFQVYYHEQLATYIMPRTAPSLLSGSGSGTIGSPEQGRTNAQNWFNHGIAIAGSMITASNTTTRAGIDGRVGPLVDPAATTQRVVLVTPWAGAFVSGNPPLRVRFNVQGQFPAIRSPLYDVWMQLDDGMPFAHYSNGGLYNVAPGLHTLTAWIGTPFDSAPNTIGDTVTFFVGNALSDSNDDPSGGSVDDGEAGDTAFHDAIAAAVVTNEEALSFDTSNIVGTPTDTPRTSEPKPQLARSSALAPQIQQEATASDTVAMRRHAIDAAMLDPTLASEDDEFWDVSVL